MAVFDYIGFVGPAGAGKDTGALYLVKNYGFSHVAMGELVGAYIREHELGALDRPNLQRIATMLREKRGADFWMQEALRAKTAPLAISGLRTKAEAEALLQKGGVIISLDATPRTRYERIHARKSEKDRITFEEFLSAEQYEVEGKRPAEINITSVVPLATHHISTEGGLEEFYNTLEALMDDLGYKKVQ